MSIRAMKSGVIHGSLCALVVATTAGFSPVVASEIPPSDTFGPVTILKDQNYALCALALAFVFDGVAYAKCKINYGESVSFTLSYPPVTLPAQPNDVVDKGGDVETVNRTGKKQNSYMVSTLGVWRRAKSSVPVRLSHPVPRRSSTTSRRARCPASKARTTSCCATLRSRMVRPCTSGPRRRPCRT